MAEAEFDFNPSQQHFLDAARREQRSFRSRILFWFLAVTAVTAVVGLIVGLMISGRWTNYQSTAGKFSVQFPEKPEEKTETAFGETAQLIGVDWGDRAFMVMHCDMPEAGEASLDVSAEGYAQDMRTGKPVVKKIELGGHPGREVKVECFGGREMRNRMYLAHGRMYQVTAVGPRGYTTSSTAEKFFASFKFTQ